MSRSQRLTAPAGGYRRWTYFHCIDDCIALLSVSLRQKALSCYELEALPVTAVARPRKGCSLRDRDQGQHGCNNNSMWRTANCETVSSDRRLSVAVVAASQSYRVIHWVFMSLMGAGGKTECASPLEQLSDCRGLMSAVVLECKRKNAKL